MVPHGFEANGKRVGNSQLDDDVAMEQPTTTGAIVAGIGRVVGACFNGAKVVCSSVASTAVAAAFAANANLAAGAEQASVKDGQSKGLPSVRTTRYSLDDAGEADSLSTVVQANLKGFKGDKVRLTLVRMNEVYSSGYTICLTSDEITALGGTLAGLRSNHPSVFTILKAGHMTDHCFLSVFTRHVHGIEPTHPSDIQYICRMLNSRKLMDTDPGYKKKIPKDVQVLLANADNLAKELALRKQTV